MEFDLYPLYERGNEMSIEDYMDKLMKVFDNMALREFIETLQNIESIYLKEAEGYPEATPPRIRIRTRDGTNEPLIAIRQRLEGYRCFDNDSMFTGFRVKEN